MKKIDRRSFLRRAGLLTAGAVTAPYVHLEAAEGRNSAPGSIARATLAGGRLSVAPVDNGRALLNPNMGFSFPYYSNNIDTYGSRLAASDTVDEFPGLTTVYFRLPWAFLEPEEGKFDWEMIDSPAQRWLQKGKQIALRITATESWMYNATPQWVFDAGAKGYEVWGGKVKEPEYDDPIFLEKMENFVRALAARYDDDPAVVEVNIGHFGMWGEMHTITTTPHHGQSWGLETVRKIFDIYLKYFKKTQLYAVDDVDGVYMTPYPRETPILDYARSKGIGLRDDTILVHRPPEQWASSLIAQDFWPTIPVSLECEHYGLTKTRENWDSELWVQSVEEYHATFMMAHWFPREMLNAEREAIDRINRRIGYRLRVNRIEWPEQVALGEFFEITALWSNAGVAPCYAGGYPCFTVKDEKGGIVAVLVDDGLNVKELAVAPPEAAASVERTVRFRIAPLFCGRADDPDTAIHHRSAQGGVFELFVSVGRPNGTPIYELPYGEHDGHKRYKVGRITLTGDHTVTETNIERQIEGVRQKKLREKEEATKAAAAK